MQLQQFFDCLKILDSIDPGKLPQLAADIKSSLESYSTDYSKLGPALFKLAEEIMKIKDVKIQYVAQYENLICEIIKISCLSDFRVGIEALRTIFNLLSEYYKTANHDIMANFPIGKDRPLKYYSPKVGEYCDVVRPYITSIGLCGWSRCTVLQVQNKKYTIKYENEIEQSTTTKQRPWFAPLGERMQDYDWRMSLQVGSPIQALLNRVWYKSTVAQIYLQNGLKKVRVTFRRFAENGDRVDSQGNRFFGLSSSQDQWIEVLSPRIQGCGKMVDKSLCYYSFNCQEAIIQDLYDIMFQKQYKEKPFYAIARVLGCKSLSLLTFINQFIINNGIQRVMKVMDNPQIIDDTPFYAISIVGAMVPYFPRMYLKQSGIYQLYDKIVPYYEKMVKHLTVNKIQFCYFGFNMIGRRIKSLSEMHFNQNQARKVLIKQFLKMNMEKQMLALRYLNELANPKKPYTEWEKQNFNKFLKQKNIFLQMFHSNLHQQILSRSGFLLQYMIKNQIISQKQFQSLWTIVPLADSRGRATIQKLLTQMSKNIPINFAQGLISKILKLKETELTIDNLNLLKQLKNRQISNESQMNILTYLWDVIAVKSVNIKSNIEEQVEKVFKAFVSTLKDKKLRMSVLLSMSQKLQQCKKVKNQIQFLKDFIKSYPQKKQNKQSTEMVQQNAENVPETIYEAIQTLKKKGIYNQLMNLLFRAKEQLVKKDILQFFSFLFEFDQDDVNQIVRKIYQKLGPTPNFLQWLSKLLKRTTDFAVQFFEKTNDLSPYQKLNDTGFTALRDMFYRVNEIKKNIRIVTTYTLKDEKKTDVGVGPVGPVLGPVAPPTGQAGSDTPNCKKEEKMIGPVLRQQQKHIFILVSPSQLIGMKFLINLLHTVSEKSVQSSISRLIVELVTSQDESISQYTEQYRRQFLNQIMGEIKKITSQNKCDQKIKKQLLGYINLIIQIFGETQKYGIGNLQPYFSKIQGERFLFRVVNLFDKEKDKKYSQSMPNFSLQCNSNITLWNLKENVSKIVNESPDKIDVIRHVNPLEDNKNGKSLGQLYFFNNQQIKVSRKASKPIPRVNLLNSEKTGFNTKFQQIIESYFDEFKDKNKDGLSLIQMHNLDKQKWKGSYFRQRGIAEKIMEDYDLDKKGYLNYNDFKRFFFEKTLKSENAIWRLLNLSGYKNNFQQANSNTVPTVNVCCLPRKILSNPQVYNFIFSVLQNQAFKQIHVHFYKLLCLLQLDKKETQAMEQKIYELIQKQKSTYALCYTVEVIITQLAKYSDFYYQFWRKNGIKSIKNRMEQILAGDKSIYALDPVIKNEVVPGFVKIMSMYAREILWPYKIVRFAAQNRINFCDVNQFVKKIDSINQPLYDQSLQKETAKKLFQLGSVQQNMRIMFQLSNKIFMNMLKTLTDEKTDSLTKTISELARIMIFFVSENQKYHEFNPFDCLFGVGNISLNNRRTASILIYTSLFYSNQPNPQQIQLFVAKLIESLPFENKVFNYTFYELLKQILQNYMKIINQGKDKDDYFIEIGNMLLEKLFNNVLPQERSQSLVFSNKIILGILQIIDMLIQKDSICHGLAWRITDITEKCLFAYKIEQKLQQVEITPEMLQKQKQDQHLKNYVICKTEDCRNAAYNIVIKMHKISPGIEPLYFDNFILPIIKSIRNDVRICDKKSQSVGIKNFGSTCYMNSMLQVLNSVVPFRNSLMKCESDAKIIIELKRLFAGLFYSERLDYAPIDLLTAFNPPINPGLQQDTTQFLNKLFDELELALSSTHYKKLLDEIFKGANTVQMICQSCGYKKQNRQQFIYFGVEIQGKFDLNAALQGSHQGQTISDYLCDHCKNRGETLKRNILSEIPNVLFIHLRRIVFNYDMFINMKIHTRLQFPQQLNIQPFTKEGVELRESLGLEYIKNLSHNEEEMKKFEQMALHGKQKEFYKLKLKGVIVHSGSADVGHYYSILSHDKSWKKFDDSRVTFFGSSSFDGQCYGGSFTAEQWGSGSSANAYVLVYEKVIKNPIHILGQDEKNTIQLKYDDIKVYNSPQNYIQVWLDNHYFMLQNHLLAPPNAKGFTNFVTKLIEDCPAGSISKIDVISEIIYKLSFHSGYVGQLLKLVQQNASTITPAIFYWYITADKQKTFRLLFSQEKVLREFMAVYMHIVIIQSYKNGNEQVRNDINAYLIQLLNSMTGEVAKNWLRVDGYFMLFNLLVNSSMHYLQLWQLFLQKNFISTLIDYVMEKQSPVRISPKNYSLGTKTNPMDFTSCISIINFYLRHSYGLTGKNYELPPIDERFLFHLNDNDVICLSFLQFYRKILKQRQNLFEMACIIQRLCIMNLEFSKGIIEIVLETINGITESKDQMQDLSHICLQILKIRDDYWEHRAQMLLGVGVPFILNNNIMTTLDEERYAFCSSLYDIFPIESLFSYSYLYRLKNTTACFYLIKAAIQGCSVSDVAMKYLARQPSPSYLYENYLSWAENFLTSFIPYATTDQNVKKRLQGQVQNLMKYVEDIKSFIANHPQIDYYKSVITGIIANKAQIQTFEKDGIEIKLFEYEVYCTQSKSLPKGGNTSMDPYVQSYKLQKSSISDSSNILKFLKKPAKTIILKLQAVQEQDKQLKQLINQPTKPIIPTVSSNTQMEIQKPQEQQQIPVPQNKPQQPSEPETEINLQHVWTDKYYRQLEVVNKTKEKKVIRITFTCEPNPNFIIAKQLMFKVFPKSNQSVWMAKQDANKEWGKMQLKSYVEEYVKQKHEKKNITSWWFKTYGDKSMENEVQTNINSEVENKPNEEAKQQKVIDFSRDIDSSQIPCPICTFINMAASNNCSVCDSLLH